MKSISTERGCLMKDAGIVKKIDGMGRIVLPIEIRKRFGIEKKDPLGIFVEDKSIILKKYNPSCIFCGSMDGLKSFKGVNICEKCIG